MNVPQYRLIESNLQSIPSSVSNKQIEIDWSNVEQMIGSRISPGIRSRYEQVCSGRSFKVFTFITLLSRIVSFGHIWFASKYFIDKGLSDTNFAIWAGIVAINSIAYLYKWWFIDKYGLRDADNDIEEGVIYESDVQQNVDIPKAKGRLSLLWDSVVNSDSKWRLLMIILLIMIAALLCEHRIGVFAENQYKKQLKNIKRLSEQDARNKSKPMPDAEQLANMDPVQAQKIAYDFATSNNLTNGKQFASALKSAAKADAKRNKAIVERVKKENPQQYEQMAQEAKSTNGKSFFDTATEKYKNVLSPGALLTNIAFTAVFCMFSGPIGILTKIISFSIPSLLVSGLGGLGSGIFTAAMIIPAFAKPAGFVAKTAGGAQTLITYVGLGLACACAIRWIFNFLLNPKKNSKKPLVNKGELNKELGGNVALKAAQNAKQKKLQNTTESYMHENTLYISEGIVSFIKDKIVNFFKGTWKCLKAVVSHPGMSKGFKIVMSLLAIGFVLATAYFGIKGTA